MDWIIFGTYILGYLLCYRVVYRIADEHEEFSDEEEMFLRVFPIFIILLFSMIWPLLLSAWLVWRIATPKTAAQRRREIEQMEQRKRELNREIYEAERLLGIKKEER